MPGIYINDPNLGSSLSNAIAKIADNMSPETRARAENLYLQSEGLNWDNRLKSSVVPAQEQGIAGAALLPGDMGAARPVVVTPHGVGTSPVAAAVGASAQPGGMAPGGVGAQNNAPAGGDGSATTSPATSRVSPVAAAVGKTADQPYVIVKNTTPGDATARGVVDTSNADILGKMAAGIYARGGGVDEINKLIQLGQTRNFGPGQDQFTQTDIVKQRELPYNLQPGEERHNMGPVTGPPGSPATWGQPAVSGPARGGDPSADQSGVVRGPDPVELQTRKDTAANLVKDVESRAGQGVLAQRSVDDMKNLMAMYDQFHGTMGQGGALFQASARAMTDALGLPSDKLPWGDNAAIEQIIRSQLIARMGQARQQLGLVGAISDYEDRLMQSTIPDPTMRTEVFKSIVNATINSDLRIVEAGKAAQVLREKMARGIATDADYAAYNEVLNRAHDESEINAARQRAGLPPLPGGGIAPQTSNLRQPTQEEQTDIQRLRQQLGDDEARNRLTKLGVNPGF